MLKALDSRTAAPHPAYAVLVEQLNGEEAHVFINLKTDKHGTILSDKGMFSGGSRTARRPLESNFKINR